MLGAETHHLTPSSPPHPPQQGLLVHQIGNGCHIYRKRRKTILEHHHVVVPGRHLSGPLRRARAQRTRIIGRLMRTTLTMGGDGDPLTQQRVPPRL